MEISKNNANSPGQQELYQRRRKRSSEGDDVILLDELTVHGWIHRVLWERWQIAELVCHFFLNYKGK